MCACLAAESGASSLSPSLPLCLSTSPFLSLERSVALSPQSVFICFTFYLYFQYFALYPGDSVSWIKRWNWNNEVFLLRRRVFFYRVSTCFFLAHWLPMSSGSWRCWRSFQLVSPPMSPGGWTLTKALWGSLYE